MIYTSIPVTPAPHTIYRKLPPAALLRQPVGVVAAADGREHPLSTHPPSYRTQTPKKGLTRLGSPLAQALSKWLAGAHRWSVSIRCDPKPKAMR